MRKLTAQWLSLSAQFARSIQSESLFRYGHGPKGSVRRRASNTTTATGYRRGKFVALYYLINEKHCRATHIYFTQETDSPPTGGYETNISSAQSLQLQSRVLVLPTSFKTQQPIQDEDLFQTVGNKTRLRILNKKRNKRNLEYYVMLKCSFFVHFSQSTYILLCFVSTITQAQKTPCGILRIKKKQYEKRGKRLPKTGWLSPI